MAVEGEKGVGALIAEAAGIYRRYPLLFLTLAAAVVVPYALIVLIATGAGPTQQGESSFAVAQAVSLVEWGVMGPLVSALHVHAVAEIAAGREPDLAAVARKGIGVLPVVIGATVISSVGIGLGFLALLVPGVLLMIRWYVVAQAAAIEREGPLAALRRSAQLTADRFGHVFGFALVVGAIVLIPTLPIWLGFGTDHVTVASFVTATVVSVFAWSFGALTTALLYFDLRARLGSAAAAAPPPRDKSPLQASWDPRVYTDENRPAGWYIVPESPHRMKYWSGGEEPAWGGATSTPRRVRKAWREELPDH